MLALKIPTQVVYTADQSAEHAGRGWVSGLFVRRWGLLSILRVIYILWVRPQNSVGETREIGIHFN